MAKSLLRPKGITTWMIALMLPKASRKKSLTQKFCSDAIRNSIFIAAGFDAARGSV
jgi:hypothetical protein